MTLLEGMYRVGRPMTPRRPRRVERLPRHVLGRRVRDVLLVLKRLILSYVPWTLYWVCLGEASLVPWHRGDRVAVEMEHDRDSDHICSKLLGRVYKHWGFPRRGRY